MKHSDYKAFLLVLIFAFAFLYNGCDDSGIIKEDPPADTMCINYNDLILSERTIPFDSAYSSIDLNKGIVVMELSLLKDAVLVGPDSNYHFYLRSGDMSLIDAGFQTRFKQYVYDDLTQQKFDSLIKIPDSDTVLNELDFEANETPLFPGYLQKHSVYGFYLKGKYGSTVTPKPVYGMIYLDSAWVENTVYKLRVDVKINTNGENHFKIKN